MTKYTVSDVTLPSGEERCIGAWPWAVALGRRLTENNVWFFCGGTLITDQHVITAAHCVKELTYDPSHPEEGYEGLVARIGDLDLDDSVDDGAKPVTILVSRSEWHPKYSESWDGYDIALLTLKTPVEFSGIQLLSNGSLHGSRHSFAAAAAPRPGFVDDSCGRRAASAFRGEVLNCSRHRFTNANGNVSTDS
ncbi:unnamed protein product [Bemisia tabaci]|uniref:Peptidase S1 domain-containing protein n=1 Tax=Bemisia tabaci TaxID=7038 RepID=A0A9P0ALN3_BEMTA|nr:unnamed protein product [Bemisia tabaci]